MPVPTGLPSFLIAPGAIAAVVSVVITAGRHVRQRRSSSAFSHKAPVRLPVVRGRGACAHQVAVSKRRSEKEKERREKEVSVGVGLSE